MALIYKKREKALNVSPKDGISEDTSPTQKQKLQYPNAGEIIWKDDNSPMKDKDGNVIKFLGTLHHDNTPHDTLVSGTQKHTKLGSNPARHFPSMQKNRDNIGINCNYSITTISDHNGKDATLCLMYSPFGFPRIACSEASFPIYDNHDPQQLHIRTIRSSRRPVLGLQDRDGRREIRDRLKDEYGYLTSPPTRISTRDMMKIAQAEGMTTRLDSKHILQPLDNDEQISRQKWNALAVDLANGFNESMHTSTDDQLDCCVLNRMTPSTPNLL